MDIIEDVSLQNNPKKSKTQEKGVELEQNNPLGEGISMIYPPPETKKVIDKAATLVAQYGIQVETSMKEDINFSFINKTDPYYPYYQSKILESKEELKKNLSKKMEEYYSQEDNKNNEKQEFLNKKRKEDNLVELEKEAKELLKEAMRDKIDLLKSDKNIDNLDKIPHPDIFSVPQPNISGTELDIIKISAQFVAKNGQKFLSDLIKREKDNPQFDFMKPQHTLFGYFTFLVGCYAKILNNKNEIISKIEKYATNSNEILKSANIHYLYDKKISKIPRGKRFSQEDLLTNEEKEKIKNIDWYDFVLVETIDFSSDEEEKKEDVNKEIIGKENIYDNNYANNYNRENNEIENNNIYANEDNITINNNEDEKTFYTSNDNNNNGKINNKEQEIMYINGKKVIKNYVREKKKPLLDEGVNDINEVKCPLCKLSIKPNKIEEHLKIELLDPKWKSIQDVINKNQEQTNLAGTGDLLIYLDDFSKSRPDLFGDVDDIKKLEKKRKEEKGKNIDHATFNGYAPTMSRTTANNNMIKIQNIRHIEESKKPKNN